MITTSDRRAVLVGLFVAVGLVILMGGVLAVGSLEDAFTRKIAVRTVFSEVGGLKSGDAVWSSGLKVGTVDEMRFIGMQQVEVDLMLDAAAAPYIPADAVAKVGSDGLIGNPIVVLTGGVATEAVAEGAVLASTRSVSTEELLSVLQENNVNLRAITADVKVVTAGLAAGEGTLGKLLTDDALYGSITDAIDTLGHAADNARRLTADIAAFSARLDDGGLVDKLVTDETLFPKIGASVERLQAAATRADDLVATVQRGLSDPESPAGALLADEKLGADLKSTVANLQTATVLLNEDLTALQSNFLFRPYFKKQERDARRQAEPPTTR